MKNLRVVSENEDPVEPTPSWLIFYEAGQGNFGQEIIHGFPSYSGPLMSFFSSEDDENSQVVFMIPYHRVVLIKPYAVTGNQVAN